MVRILVLAALSLAIAACGPLVVQRVDPKPNVAMAGPTGQSIRLAFAPDVRNDFQCSGGPGFTDLKFERWHESLAAGFKRGFSDYFKVQDADTDTTLELTRTDPTLSSAAVRGDGRVMAVHAHLTYKARLLDRSGNVVKVAAGTAVSKAAVTRSSDVPLAFESAVESMYEEIAKAF